MISVTILTKNSQETLRETLESVKEFPEVLVFDTGSTDGTLAIAEQFSNVKIFHHPFWGFGPTHNAASELATNDWILSLDSDEVLSDELSCEIRKIALDPNYVYAILRHNYLNGKWIKWCGGWHPDWIVRLYNRQKTRFTDAAVHEEIIKDGLQVKKLRYTMRHTPYRQVGDFLAKMQAYSALFAEQHRGKKQSSFSKALLHGFSAFFKSYFLKRGFLGGKEGWIISVYNGQTAYYKYLKLAELNRL